MTLEYPPSAFAKAPRNATAVSQARKGSPGLPRAAEAPLRVFHVRLEVTPVAQARARVSRSSGNVYYTGEQVAARDALSYLIYNSMTDQGFAPWKAGVALELTVTFGVPHSDKRLWGKPKPTSSDIDNYLKMLMDAMQGELFANDGQVYRVVAEKRYAPHPGYIDIEVKEDA